MALYKHVLHHSANQTPKSFLEALGVYVCVLNNCGYCVEHHFQGLRRLLGDDERCAKMREAFEADDLERAFNGAELAAMRYACALTQSPGTLASTAIEDMRAAGMSDGEILEVNQVVSYFSYANRTVLGLGINTKGDVLGLSPGNSDDPSDWGHR